MKKYLITVCASLLLWAGASVAAPDMPTEPLELKGSKKSVLFPHVPHKSIACVDCHHLVNDKENFSKCASSGCHDDITEKKGERSLYRVMHAKKDTAHSTCLSCHQQAAEQQPERKKELTGCAQSKCHPGAAAQ